MDDPVRGDATPAPAETSDPEPTLGLALLRAERVAAPEHGLRFCDRKEHETFLHWRTVADRSRVAAGTLAAAGVAPGDRVAIILPTCPEFMDVFFGCQLLGAVPVPLYPPVRLGRLEEYVARTTAMLDAVQARVLVADQRIRAVIGQVLLRALVRPTVVPAGQLASGVPATSAPGDDPDALCMVQFSSGTTTHPKAVALTHRQVLANTDAILAHIPFDTDGVRQAGVSWLPLYHDMGLIGCVFPALRRPGPLTLIPPEAFLHRPALWLRAISRTRGTISPAPDFAYALCAERIRDEELEGVDLSSWRLALDGAEPIATATLRAFTERFARWGLRSEALTPVYGLSEAALAVTFSDPDRPARSLRVDADALASGQATPAADGVALVSLGSPLPGFDVRIRTEASDAVEGEVGRLHVRGPSLLAGYLSIEDGAPVLADPTVDGWLDTGDVGFIHDGELYVTGRARDIVIVAGRNHAPSSIERAVDDVDGVRTGCAVAVGDVTPDGEHVLVFVEVRGEQPAGMAEACRRAVVSHTGLDPHAVVLLPPGTLPRTSSGKLRRAETLRRWRDRTLLPPDRVTAVQLAGALAKSMLGYLKVRTRH